MRHTLLSIFVAIAIFAFGATQSQAQNTSAQAKAVLDKTAKIVGRTGGISASFSMSNPNTGTVSGTIAVKGNKFNARTPQATVWFNGKTQWTYMKKSNEVNVSTPTAAQQQMMNPYTFVNIYKSGYKLAMTKAGNSNVVHLVAQNSKQSIQEMYVTVNAKTSVPSQIKMKHSGKWYTINVTGFYAKNQPNSMFTFNSKDYPSAEIIDLR